MFVESPGVVPVEWEAPSLPDDDTLRYLHRAYELLEKGWSQGHMEQGPLFYDEGRNWRYCLMGAMNKARYGTVMRSWGEGHRYAYKGVRRTSLTGVAISLAYWNDAPGRTKEEVLEAVGAAISAREADLRG